jgi:EmrB/QacA subfamily drug resistance transporter
MRRVTPPGEPIGDSNGACTKEIPVSDRHDDVSQNLATLTQTASGPPPIGQRRLLVIIGALLLGMILASLDQTIVATALPTIAGDLHGLDHLSWVVTAYILASTASTPLWGKLGDQYGRKIFFQAAIVIFLVGSVLSGLSTSMLELIAFRAIQGIGGGGLLISAQAIVGDVVAPRDRGKYQGIFGAVFGVTSVIGPLIGGFFVQDLSWRWVFYVNLPLGAVALAVTAIVLPAALTRVHHVIDYLGTVLLAGAATSLVLLTTLGGSTYRWASPQIILLAALGVVLLAAFVLAERRAAEPVIPLRLFASRVFSVSSAIGFVVGFAMFGAITYLPQYLQVVKGASPTGSGLQLLPLMAGLLLTSTLSGILISRWGRYKIFPIAGTAIMTVGMYLLSHLGVATGTWESSSYMFVLGVGIGSVMQVLVIAVQNVVPYSDLGVATAGATFFRSIGGSFGTAVFGAIFASQLTGNLARYLAGTPVPAGFKVSSGASPATLATLPPAVHEGYIHAYAASLDTVFLIAVPIAAVAFALTWLLKEVPLRKTSTATNPADTLAPTALPAARTSADEISRALSVLAAGQGRENPYRHLAARVGLDLDPAACWMLLRLHDHPGDSLEALARRVSLPPASLAALISALFDRGLAVPETDANGHSAVPPRAARLTSSGEAAAASLATARRDVLRDLVQDWSPEQYTELADLLTRLAGSLVQEPARDLIRGPGRAAGERDRRPRQDGVLRLCPG